MALTKYKCGDYSVTSRRGSDRLDVTIDGVDPETWARIQAILDGLDADDDERTAPQPHD